MNCRVVAILLAALMVFSLFGCGNNGDKESSGSVVSSDSELSSEDEVWVPYDSDGKIILTDRDATGREAAVSSTSWYASKTGIDVLKNGGNAVDAAVAIAYTLGVVEPYTSGIGGGGYMTIYNASSNEVIMLDFRETAPMAADARQWLDADGNVLFYTTSDGTALTGAYSRLNRLGGLAVAVPGELAGLEEALTKYGSGKFTRAQLMADGIRYATEGYRTTPMMAESTNEELTQIMAMEEVSEYYLNDGWAYETDEIIKNPDLAKTYELIADQGPDVFYKGEIADAIISSVSKYGGNMTKDDLAGYSVIERTPLSSDYRGYKVYALPPSSSGGTHLIEILNILENYDFSSMEINSPQYVHAIAEATKIAFADRAAYMFEGVSSDILDGLTSKEYAAERFSGIDSGNGTYTHADPSSFEHGSTTSYSVMDNDGNMVTVTQTIGDFFGSKVAVGGYGFILNDEMYDFSLDPESVNCAKPGARPLSCITPTVVLTPEGKPFLTIGTPGGTRIFSVVAQVIERMIDYDMDVQDAINTTRVWAEDEKELHYERTSEDSLYPLSEETLKKLEEMGYTLSDKSAYDNYFGGVQAIELKSDGSIRGGADPRRSGKALAY